MDNEYYHGNENIKRRGISQEFTEEQVAEYIKCSADPIYFIKTYVKIVTIDEGIVPFELWPYQEEMINTIESGRFTIIKAPRQSGKTQGIAGFLLHYSLFNDNKLIAILANKASQAREILDRIKKAFELLPGWLQQGVVTWNKGDIEYENGSRIVADSTSSTGGRGKAVALLYLDEFCFVHKNIQDDFFKSTYPTITSAKTSRLVITSTPNGFDLFYKLWTESIANKNSFKRVQVEWDDVPGRDEEWRKETISNIGEEQFREEFGTEFLGSTNTLLPGYVLQRLAMKDPIETHYAGCLRIFEHKQPGREYFMTVDTSRGKGIDYSAFCVFDVSSVPYKIVATYKSNIIDPLVYPEVIYTVAKQYNNAHTLVEINDIGQQVADLLFYDYEYENVVFTSIKGRAGQVIGGGYGTSTQRGVRTTKPVKSIGCSNVKTMIENDQLIFWDYDLIYEFSCFVKKGASYEATSGDHDDLVMCTVLFAWATGQQFFKDLTNIDIRAKLMEDRERLLFDDILPFGFIDDGGNEDLEVTTSSGSPDFWGDTNNKWTGW